MPIENSSSRFAFLLDVLRHEAISQFRDCQRAPLGGLLTRWVVTMRHRSQDDLCPRSGGLWRRFSHIGDGVAPDRGDTARACSVDHNVRHGTGRPDPDAKAGEFRVPDGKLLCLRLQPVDDALGDPKVGHGCPSFERKAHRGNTGETPKRKSRETYGSRVHSEMPIARAFSTVWER